MLQSKNLNVTMLFLSIALISLIFADFSISTYEPFLELKKTFQRLFLI